MAEHEPAITVTHVDRDRMQIAVRGHTMFSDQPLEEGGGDTGPTPTELFVAGLAACVAFYAERFLRRHELPTRELAVACDYGWTENPHRIGAIEITVDAPGLPPAKRSAFQRVIERCAVHNTLLSPPLVLIRLARSKTVAA